ncbi:hypothetical protein FA95DRAFT_652665 [Auriscalpium vulgare]|uniref:Uncharacterized protein n=1 Tax=Auriscalpium vulgare TaxID=40419 RepID=A0ACB8RCK8_9AGAM|nr:hypothetical protein FA95DRAFT_652665 [Auriscalpium vulgare]
MRAAFNMAPRVSKHKSSNALGACPHPHLRIHPTQRAAAQPYPAPPIARHSPLVSNPPNPHISQRRLVSNLSPLEESSRENIARQHTPLEC